MVSSSKILTVSYGTFSCTAEGFDDPLAVVKDTTHFFRGVVREDRFFGAEPPQFDAELATEMMRARLAAEGQENGTLTLGTAMPSGLSTGAASSSALAAALAAGPARTAAKPAYAQQESAYAEAYANDDGLPDDDTIEATAVVSERLIDEDVDLEAAPVDAAEDLLTAEDTAAEMLPVEESAAPAPHASSTVSQDAPQDTAKDNVVDSTATEASAPAPGLAQATSDSVAAKLERIRAVVSGAAAAQAEDALAASASQSAADADLVAESEPDAEVYDETPEDTSAQSEDSTEALLRSLHAAPEDTETGSQAAFVDDTAEDPMGSEVDDDALSALLGELQQDLDAEDDTDTELAISFAEEDGDEDGSDAFADTLAGLLADADEIPHVDFDTAGDAAPQAADDMPAVDMTAEDMPTEDMTSEDKAPRKAATAAAATGVAAAAAALTSFTGLRPKPEDTLRGDHRVAEASQDLDEDNIWALTDDTPLPAESVASDESFDSAELAAAYETAIDDELEEEFYEDDEKEAPVADSFAEEIAAEFATEFATEQDDAPAAEAYADDAEEAAEAQEDPAPAQPPRARVMRVKRAEFLKAVQQGHLEEVSDDEEEEEASYDAALQPAATLTGSLTAEEEDELARELAAVKAELSSDLDAWNFDDEDEDDLPEADYAAHDRRETVSDLVASGLDFEEEDHEAATDAAFKAALARRAAAERHQAEVEASRAAPQSVDFGFDDEDEDDEDFAAPAPGPLRLEHPVATPQAYVEEDEDDEDETFAYDTSESRRSFETDHDAHRNTASAEAALDAEDEDDEEGLALEALVRDSARKAVKMASPARVMLTERNVADDDTSRLMNQTDEEMDEPEGNRRRTAIAHLRAAVAATKADRLLGRRTSDAAEEQEPYREDLANVVRPRRAESPRSEEAAARPAPTAAPASARPASPTRPMPSRPTSVRPGPATARPSAPRPAPLKLVAEQRVGEDGPRREAPAANDLPRTTPVRPRRVQQRSADAAPSGESSGFVAYAEEVGATDLPELLEAAAAYMSYVEGLDQFSRPQLMSTVRQAEAEESSREDRLRSFGQLLRDGKIQKTAGGRFTASDRISFKPDRRAV